MDSENSALSPSLLNNQLNRGFFSTIRTKLSAAYNWLLYLYLLKWCLTSRRPFFLLEHLLNPTHFLLLFTWTKLGSRGSEEQIGQSYKTAISSLLLFSWGCPPNPQHESAFLQAPTWPKGSPFSPTVLEQLAVGRRSLFVLSWVVCFNLTSQSGEELTWIMFIRLLLLTKNSQSSEWLHQPLGFLRDGWVGLPKERLPSWVSGMNPVFHKPCLFPNHRKNYKMTEKQRGATGSRMT